MYYFCSYFSQDYLVKGLALYHSLVLHCSPFQLWIVCLDDTTFQVLSQLQLPQVHVVPLTDLEKSDHDLLKAKENRSLVEYYYTLTPCVILHVLEHNPDADVVTCMDADLCFLSPIEPVYQELGNKSILIIPHRFSPALTDKVVFGMYNAGFLTVRRDVNGLACLAWWRKCCLAWCHDRVENGRYTNQKYLDDWPERFAGVVVSHHTGAGLAIWNIANYQYSVKNGTLFADGQPVIFYHFSRLIRVTRWVYDSGAIHHKTKLPVLVNQNIYVPYMHELDYIIEDITKKTGVPFYWHPFCQKQHFARKE
jgi:hypothetical protein